VKKALLLAAAAGAMLIGSAPPRPSMPAQEGVGYPPCSRTLRDRCIQMHERGVATPDNLARNEDARNDEDRDDYAGGPPPPAIMPAGRDGDGEPEMDSVVGAPAPMPSHEVRLAQNDYPACAGGVEDRCMQERILVRHHERMLRLGERG
jgi:hypothetical protein